MHLLAAQPGGITDGSQAVDLGQSPGDIVVLSAADSELETLARARAELGDDFPAVRLASLLNLTHNFSVDTYVGDIIEKAQLVVVRLLGGVSYWPYGVEQVVEACRRHDIALALLPGDDQPDAELAAFSTLPAEASHRLWQYGVHGGLANARSFLGLCAELIGRDGDWREPLPLLRSGLYWPGESEADLAVLRAHWQAEQPVAALVFYRALYQAGNLDPVDGLIAGLMAHGLNPLPVYVASLKEDVSAATLRHLLEETRPGVILNATGFSVSAPGAERRAGPFDTLDCPVLQVVFAGGTAADWRNKMNGLSARDIAMNVALPEVDGRILSRAVSFKGERRFDRLSELLVVAYEQVPDRIDFTAALAANWCRLARVQAADRRIALIFANYPNRDGRLGNGVGLDTPAGAINILKALAAAGYHVGELPADGDALIRRLAAGPTNDLVARAQRDGGECLALADYESFFDTLPASVRDQVNARWGAAHADPFVVDGGFRLAAFQLGNVTIALQPARGYNIDPVTSYHDPALVPPHGYLAFYAWLRQSVGVHAMVHLGKHGNLEWLPGKSLALSQDCFPEAILGPLPHLYPFIVNDPGEGTQAKRRAAACIIDHLTPPLTRAESYGPMAELELLVDEYYEAAGVDPRRLNLLRRQILERTRDAGLDQDIGIEFGADDDEQALAKLDNYLCELKELQIRDGLHIFGQAPSGRQLRDLLVALTRLPRREGKNGDASLIRALAGDLGLNTAENRFDPLDCEMGAPWPGPRPPALASQSGDPWRSTGDTLERLEELAADLVAGEVAADGAWTTTRQVLETIEAQVGPAVDSCGEAEIAGLLTGLDGHFVEPGPSGAPTRGRLDVLPTGRNFYSVDSRTVPTPAAWHLGWKSAELLVRRHAQDHGSWPKRLALSAWGTANMRTGGDDIAQALALIGVRPTWEPSSRRVTGFEILPSSLLERPRVDVTLRISGFFRDAFPNLIDLFDSAVRAVAALDEADDVNPIRARIAHDRARLTADGVPPELAERRAAARVFGAKPGAYGAGLQALMDEKGWQGDADLAQAYLAWGGYAYGGGAQGAAAHGLFRSLLADTQAVVHNQDNREHDILDSDDYYQFEGGLTAAVRHYSGQQPAIYHNDHSRPERPRIDTLEAEIARIVRARAANPKWISGVMRHGYKGAFEIAATVDYLFAFAATTHVVKDHHFDALYDAYLGDDAVRSFIEEYNPAALREIANKLKEALDRGLWRARSNSAYASLDRLSQEKIP